MLLANIRSKFIFGSVCSGGSPIQRRLRVVSLELPYCKVWRENGNMKIEPGKLDDFLEHFAGLRLKPRHPWWRQGKWGLIKNYFCFYLLKSKARASFCTDRGQTEDRHSALSLHSVLSRSWCYGRQMWLSCERAGIAHAIPFDAGVSQIPHVVPPRCLSKEACWPVCPIYNVTAFSSSHRLGCGNPGAPGTVAGMQCNPAGMLPLCWCTQRLPACFDKPLLQKILAILCAWWCWLVLVPR